MTTIKLPPLPHHPHHFLHWSDAEKAAIRARDIEVAKCVLEAAAKACDKVAVDATSEKRMKFLTVQGQAVYEGMYGGAINCAGGIRALDVSHD